MAEITDSEYVPLGCDKYDIVLNNFEEKWFKFTQVECTITKKNSDQVIATISKSILGTLSCYYFSESGVLHYHYISEEGDQTNYYKLSLDFWKNPLHSLKSVALFVLSAIKIQYMLLDLEESVVWDNMFIDKPTPTPPLPLKNKTPCRPCLSIINSVNTANDPDPVSFSIAITSFIFNCILDNDGSAEYTYIGDNDGSAEYTYIGSVVSDNTKMIVNENRDPILSYRPINKNLWDLTVYKKHNLTAYCLCLAIASTIIES